ncbi:hypothetical protein [Agathobaculum desmolans]|uniref:hypothetical protein n=1 Tax=Agathobaculum desmolans TaxID=39484 RepID=UPI00248EFAD2|nr:hypothetical protein [Agathobaculum desmolans]
MRKEIGAALTAMLLLTGCSSGEIAQTTRSDNASESVLANQQENMQTDIAEPEQESSIPGSYTVPDGWVKSDKHSSSNMVFYVEKGHEEDELPDNISISVGVNRYSAEEHTKFKDAIVKQLLMQLNGENAQLDGTGSNTEQGYVVYTFTIDDSTTITKQYYIVKDFGFCLVQLTNFTGSDSAYQAAQTIVDSFVWDDEE